MDDRLRSSPYGAVANPAAQPALKELGRLEGEPEGQRRHDAKARSDAPRPCRVLAQKPDRHPEHDRERAPSPETEALHHHRIQVPRAAIVTPAAERLRRRPEVSGE